MMQKTYRGPEELCEMSQSQVAEALFLKQQTISKIERKAIAKFKELFEKKGIDILDYLQE